MKSGAGKAKGGQFERDIAKLLSLWFSEGALKDTVARSEGSGARFTSSAKTGAATGTPGDLMPKHPLAFAFFTNFVVECKFWRNLNMINFLQKEGDLYKAMEKVQKEAEDNGREWMLIAKQNSQPIFVLMPAANQLVFKLEDQAIVHHLFNNTVCMFHFTDMLKIPIANLFEVQEKV